MGTLLVRTRKDRYWSIVMLVESIRGHLAKARSGTVMSRMMFPTLPVDKQKIN